MASGVSDFGAAQWLAGLFGIVSLPTTYYIGVTLQQPGIDADGDIVAAMEPPTAAGYHRVSYGTGPSNWGINSGNLSNQLDIDFGTPTADWGLLTHYVLCSAATSGAVYAYGQFNVGQFAGLGDGVVLPAGGMAIQLSALDVSIAV